MNDVLGEECGSGIIIVIKIIIIIIIIKIIIIPETRAGAGLMSSRA